MFFSLISNLFLSISLFLLLGCGNGTLTGSVKTNHFVTQSISSPLKINEILSANANINYDPDYKEFSDWIEIYNDSNKTINLEDYFLSDSKKNIQKWKFPSGATIEPFGYLLVWADGKNQNLQALHTNFKLSSSGESVTLSNPSGVIIDRIKFPYQEGDISCGARNGKIVYLNPTPKRKNSKSYDLPRRTTPPTFSIKGGFYKGSQILELIAEPNSKIYYTLDGTTPTINSTPYENPITIDKTTVVRTIALQEDKFVSRPKTYTYLIDENISLPVVSLSIDEKYLNDSEIGIYKNFNEDWMRAGNVEYIKDGVSQFSVGVGIKMHGGSSRRATQKSFSIEAKSQFGSKYINYPLFDDKPNIVHISSFLLRNSGSDWGYAFIRDALATRLAKEIGNLDYMSYQPAIVFLNGKYFGIENIREKMNYHYLENNHHTDKKNIDLLGIDRDYKMVTLRGTDKDFLQLLDYIETNSLNDEDNYKYISSKIDIDEFINYTIFELFTGNVDWPQNNLKYWKSHENSGKWRWLLYDNDMSFGLKIKNVPLYADVNYDTINRMNSPILDPDPQIKIYRKLLNNDEFKNAFIAKFSTLLNTVFLPKNINNHINAISNKIKPEMSNYLNRWFSNQMDIIDWEENIKVINNYANKRAHIMQNLLQKDFNLGEKVNISIPIDKRGDIFVENIKLNQDLNGYYFQGTNLHIKAVAKDGFHFLRWSNGDTKTQISLTINEPITLYAIYESDY